MLRRIPGEFINLYASKAELLQNLFPKFLQKEDLRNLPRTALYVEDQWKMSTGTMPHYKWTVIVAWLSNE